MFMYQGKGVVTATTPNELASKTTQRVRVKHNKVRSGCLTCKIRRKKCDEAKPFCARCVKAGVKCDGYLRGNPVKVGVVSADGARSTLLPDVERWSRTVFVDASRLRTAALRDDGCWERVDLQQEGLAQTAYVDAKADPLKQFNDLQLRQGENGNTEQNEDERSETIGRNGTQLRKETLWLPRIPSARAELPQISDLEGHCLSYFRHRTVPGLATYFECCIWRDDIVQDTIEIAHPALFYATIALGAAHRRFSMGITPEAFEYCAHSARLYKRAVSVLEQLKHSMRRTFHSSDRRVQSDLQSVIAACEVLLGIFQEFQGERYASAAHVMSGVQHIIASPLRFLKSEALSCSGPTKPRVACQMMYKLYCRATQLLGTPVRLFGNQRLGIRASPLQPEIPEAFTSLEEMRDHLFTIVDNLWNTWPRGLKEFDVAWGQLQAYELNLQAWAAACVKTAQNPEMMREPWQKKTFNLLHLTRSVAYLILCGSMGVGNPLTVAPIATTPTFKVGDASDDLEEAARWMGNAVERLRQEGPETSLVQVRRIVEDILEKHKIFCFEDGQLPDGPDPFTENYEDASHQLVTLRKPDVGSAMEMVGLFSIAKTISEMEENATIQIIKGVVPPNADFRYVDIACIFVDTRKLVVRYYAPRPEGEGLVWVRESWSF